MIRPPCGSWRRIWAKAARAHKNDPAKFTSTTLRHSSTEISSMVLAGVPAPALLNSMSSRPCSATIFATAASTASGSETSQGSAMAREPAPLICAVSSNGARRRPIKPTFQPSARSAKAAARPTPVPAPVTIATPAMVSSSVYVPKPIDRREPGGKNEALICR
jgi:hypothetical protein